MKNNYGEISSASASEIIDDNNEFLLKVHNEVNRWIDSEIELSRGRTDFQIEKFIIHENPTIPSAFKAAIINRKSVAEGILDRVIAAKCRAREFHLKWDDKDKTQPMWWETPHGGKELCWYDIEEFLFHKDLENLCRYFETASNELEFFDKIINRLIELNGGKLITREQFDNDQPEYWQRRLSNQSLDDILQKKTGISSGNISSMRRASAATVLTNDKNRTKGSFGDFSDPLKLLEDLQKNIESGIAEISGKDKKFLPDIQKQQKSLIDNEKGFDSEAFNIQKKTNSSFFNQDLKK